ncbi:unnamed protein product, partial [Discosporangium mesarthrocarpum]
MSPTRRRRLMVDSDDDAAGNSKTGAAGIRGKSEPDSRDVSNSAMKRRKILVDADEEGDEAPAPRVAAGTPVDDEEAAIELRRRRQLAERWSKLNEDSDCEEAYTSEGPDLPHVNHPKTFTQLQLGSAWVKALGRTGGRSIAQEHHSGEECENHEDLPYFIPKSDGDDSPGAGERTARGRGG